MSSGFFCSSLLLPDESGFRWDSTLDNLWPAVVIANMD